MTTNVPALPPMAQERKSGPPDIAWIKKNVPIMDLAEQLGIRTGFQRRGATWVPVHCFRPWNHKNGDRSPSLNLNLKNNRFQCFCCDRRMASNIDLVMLHEEIKSPHEAALWIAQRFKVPSAPPKPMMDWEFRAGVDEISGLEDAVKAGLLRLLTPSQRSILFSLWAFRNASDVVQVSYRTLMDCSGVGSDHTVKKAIRRFEDLGLMEVQRSWDRETKQRARNRYSFTWDNPQLLSALLGLTALPGALETGGLTAL